MVVGLYNFFRDQGSIIAGLVALIAALLTIRAIRKSADREIAAAQEQTKVAQDQIATSLRIEYRRNAREAWASYVTLEAATGVVLDDVKAAREMLPNPGQNAVSQDAYQARQRIRKSSFPDLRNACLKLGGQLTEPFLRLENDIDDFAAKWQIALAPNGLTFRTGWHFGFNEQLERIEIQARALHQAAGDARKKSLEVLTIAGGDETLRRSAANPGEAGGHDADV